MGRAEVGAAFENCARMGLNLLLFCKFRHGYSETNRRFHRREVDGSLEMRGYAAFVVKLGKCRVFLSDCGLS